MKNDKVSKVSIVAIIAIICCLALTLTACVSTGKSAYDIAVKNGYTGTEEEWLESLKGDTIYTDSAYDLAVKYGFSGTEEEWLKSLKGEKGDKGETTTTNAVNKAILSVVSINSYFTKTTSSIGFFGNNKESKEYGSAGSGVIIGGDKEKGEAYIITNYHVVYDADADVKISNKIFVYLYGQELDKYKISATYIGGSMSYDIAVLKIQSDVYKESNAHAATIGKSGDMTVGDSVIAIGNPNAGGIAVTQGILSMESEYITMTAADNVSTVQIRVMRVDAAINGGNSGGGLFNDSGELIGIVNAKVVSEKIEGMAYAIPVDFAYPAAQNILKNCDGDTNTQILRSFMGISVQVTDSATEIADDGTVRIVNTVSVASVEANSPAAKAGVQKGDVIKSFRFASKLYLVEREYDITNIGLLLSEGDVVEINLLRNGTEVTRSMTIEKATAVK